MEVHLAKSLVADYDSTSEEEQPYAESGNDNSVVSLTSASEMLNQNSDSISTSIFSNPYREAENYEQSILEKHVKMTVIKETKQATKKICYKYNKGKCKLGDKCQYLHQNSTQLLDNRLPSDDEDVGSEKIKDKSKKRCGLKNDLIPPKKFMKTYNKVK